MRYRTLGSSGLRVSVLGLGCSAIGDRLDDAAAAALVAAALDAGINWFDTADVYGDGAGERALGRCLKGVRDQVVVATKARWPTGPGQNDRGASRIHLRAAVEASLRRLDTDRIDLYQVHAPDPATPMDETVGVLEDLVRQGKILYAGLSNYAGWQLVDAHWRAAHLRQALFIGAQTPFNLVQQDARRELLPAAKHCGIGVIACLVLARGLLSGSFGFADDGKQLSAKQRAYLTPANQARLAVISSFAAERDLTLAELAISAVAATEGISTLVIGASSAEQVLSNAVALGRALPVTELVELQARLAGLD